VNPLIFEINLKRNTNDIIEMLCNKINELKQKIKIIWYLTWINLKKKIIIWNLE